jgi:eukaryotic-like serine/threonine-protein kinase
MNTTRNIGCYTKAVKIDSGGFGTVYSAYADENLKVALKQLNDLGVTEKDKKRFIREVKIGQGLKHANIVPILSYDLDCTLPWFSMPLAMGNLRRMIPNSSSDESIALSIFQQILIGVSYLHSMKIVHRDLKPENVLIFDWKLRPGALKISDFGLGKRLDRESVVVTSSKDYMGSAAYAPPEQFSDLHSLTERADVFSLGKIFFELITGQFPMHVNLRHPKVKGKWEYIIGKCLEHEPQDRYESASEILRMIELHQKETNFVSQTDKAKALINSMNTGHFTKDRVIELRQILMQKNEDSSFIVSRMTEISEGCLKAIVQNYWNEFESILFEYCQQVESSSFGFGYCDTIADKSEEIFRMTDNLRLRLSIIESLLELAASHSRYHVGGVVGSLIGALKNHEEIIGVRDLILRHPSEAKWCRSYISSSRVPQVISEALASLGE